LTIARQFLCQPKLQVPPLEHLLRPSQILFVFLGAFRADQLELLVLPVVLQLELQLMVVLLQVLQLVLPVVLQLALQLEEEFQLSALEEVAPREVKLLLVLLQVVPVEEVQL
jgi:hypothetical protein